MIILQEVAQKLENILNGTDDEVGSSGSLVIATNPTAFYFEVETEGFHIDHIVSQDKDKNFIPVFVSSVGGQFNPVPHLEQGTVSLSMDFYFPVRFKNDMFLLGNFLVKAFVGTKLNYGGISGKAVSNISYPQYGEITQPLDLKELQTWVNGKYQKTIEVHEPYFSMRLVLYLTNAASGFVFGNDVTSELKFTYGENTYTLKNVYFDGANIQSNSQPQSEQAENTNEAVSFPFSTAYGASFKVYPNIEQEAYESTYVEQITYIPNVVYYTKSGDTYTSVGELTEGQYSGYHGQGIALYIRISVYFYKELLKVWLSGNIQIADFEIKFTIANDSDLTFTRKCFVSSVVAPINKGELFSLTMSFAKKAEIEV